MAGLPKNQRIFWEKEEQRRGRLIFCGNTKNRGWSEEQSEVDKHIKKDTEVPVSWQGSRKIKGFFGKRRSSDAGD